MDIVKIFTFIQENNWLITIAGFLVSFIVLKRTFRQEVDKQRTSITLNKIEDVPLMIQEFFNKSKNGIAQNQLQDVHRLMLNRILSYGSKTSTMIASEMMKYSRNENRSSSDFSIVAYYALLFCSIRFEISGIKITPVSWYEMNISDYLSRKSEFDGLTNAIVKKHNLPRFLKCKSVNRKDYSMV